MRHHETQLCEDNELTPGLTVREQIELFGRLRGLDEEKLEAEAGKPKNRAAVVIGVVLPIWGINSFLKCIYRLWNYIEYEPEYPEKKVSSQLYVHP